MALESDSVAVLVSGGLDSSVLCVAMAKEHRRVYPLYVRCGLGWEAVELAACHSFLRAVVQPGLEPLTVLDEPIRDVYGTHWSTGGGNVPGADTPDEAVYLPGRNLLLTVKASIWCRLRGIGGLALGCLGSNPFPDSTPGFFQSLEMVLGSALRGTPRLVRPFDGMHKPDVIRLGFELPLELTFSCIEPRDGAHCGRCNKCAERRSGFASAEIIDRTAYASNGPADAVPHSR